MYEKNQEHVIEGAFIDLYNLCDNEFYKQVDSLNDKQTVFICLTYINWSIIGLWYVN